MNKIHFLNTIWSDAILLESNSKFAFIDTGKKLYESMIKDYLDKNNVKEIEFIFLTHFHNDHYGCIPMILNNYKVKKVYLREYSGHDGSTGDGTVSTDEYHDSEMATYEMIKALSIEKSQLQIIDENLKTLDFGDFHFDILALQEHIKRIYNDKNSDLYHVNRFNENYDCVSLFTKLNGRFIYLGADVTNCDNNIKEMDHINLNEIKRMKEKYGFDHIDIYKVSHHGVHDSTNQDSANLIKADYAVITNTNRWLDRYPTYEYLRNANKDVKILQTDIYQHVFEIKDNGEIILDSISLKSLFDE